MTILIGQRGEMLMVRNMGQKYEVCTRVGFRLGFEGNFGTDLDSVSSGVDLVIYSSDR